MTTRSGNWTVSIDGKKLAAFMRSPNGPLYRKMAKAALVVKEGAKRQVGVYKPPDAYSASNRARRPGTLRDSIVSRVIEHDGLPLWVVGSDDPIAKIHHEGTEPHEIWARRAPFLVFYWPKAGGVVHFRMVHHPGTKPNHYLTDQLPIAMAIIKSA